MRVERPLNPATLLASALCALEPAALGRTPRRIPPWTSLRHNDLRDFSKNRFVTHSSSL